MNAMVFTLVLGGALAGDPGSAGGPFGPGSPWRGWSKPHATRLRLVLPVPGPGSAAWLLAGAKGPVMPRSPNAGPPAPLPSSGGAVPYLPGLTQPPSGGGTARDTLTHQRRAMIALLAWSGVSLAAGTGLLFLKRDPWTGIAIQSLAWGVIDGVIAAVALAKLPASYDDPAAAERSRRRFRKILLINTALDVVWVLVGAALVIWGNDTVRGHGYGVLAQGGFLLTFDGVNALLTY